MQWSKFRGEPRYGGIPFYPLKIIQSGTTLSGEKGIKTLLIIDTRGLSQDTVSKFRNFLYLISKENMIVTTIFYRIKALCTCVN